uniref:Cytochrome c oxidase assembly factor 3 n=1 Tax=Sarcoptes scabiei TaxID=52283 RepID=A0A834RD20_SARSC
MSDKSVKSSRTDFDKVLKTFVNKAEQQHRLNQNQIENIRRKNRIAGLFFGALVISIYSFTMYNVKQEKFLDKIDDDDDD